MKYVFLFLGVAWFIILQLQKPHIADIRFADTITGEQLYLAVQYISVRIAAYTTLATAFVMQYIDTRKGK